MAGSIGQKNKELTQLRDHINPTAQQHNQELKNTDVPNLIQVKRLDKNDVPILALLAAATIAFVGLVYYFRPVINNNFSFDGAELGMHLFTWVDYTDMLTTALF